MIKLPRAISKEAIQIQAELTTQEAWRSHKPPLHARGKCATTPTMWQGDELVLGIGKVKGPNLFDTHPFSTCSKCFWKSFKPKSSIF